MRPFEPFVFDADPVPASGVDAVLVIGLHDELERGGIAARGVQAGKRRGGLPAGAELEAEGLVGDLQSCGHGGVLSFFENGGRKPIP